MQQKYAHYLASRMYSFAPLDEQKATFRKQVSAQIGKLILHAYASEVIEFIYSTGTSDEEKREMVFGLYGNYTLVLREILDKDKNASLKQFIELKPQLTAGLLDRLESLVTKLVVKGHTRHTIVQAVLLDYVEC